MLRMKKIRLGVVFGGKSPEHDVSLLSAKNLIAAIDREKYDLTLIGIDKEGHWHFYDSLENPKEAVILDLGQLILNHKVDVIFPTLHGVNGEDGTIQGLLRLLDIPFVGSGILGSAVGMDKDVMKRLLVQAGFNLPKFLSIQKHEMHDYSFSKIAERVGLPFFVKPANMGSSIGIGIVKERQDFESIIAQAFQYDQKILIEEAIEAKEIEVGVIGNEFPKVSLPCEIIPKSGLQTYLSKYVDEDEAESRIPVLLEPEMLSAVQITAIDVYKTLLAKGMARVDLFLTEEGRVLVNEINTLPGLTCSSPFAKMWEATGICFGELVDRLITLAFDRFEKEKSVCTHYSPPLLEYEQS